MNDVEWIWSMRMRRSNGGEENRAQVLCMFFLFLVYTSANFIAIVFVLMCVCIFVYIYSFSPTFSIFIILLIMYEKKSLTIFSLTRDRVGSIKENRNGNRSNSLIRLIVQWNLIEQIKHNTCTIANTT